MFSSVAKAGILGELPADGSQPPTAHIVVLDNYDSFTYSLVQLLLRRNCRVSVYLNDSTVSERLLESRPDGVILSPGPGRPKDAGILNPLIEQARGKVPLLGICLGHQALAAAIGATLDYVPRQRHGRCARLRHDASGLFAGLDQGAPVACYHSLTVNEESLPEEAVVTARCEDGEVMAFRFERERFDGIQFHPESALTRDGGLVIGNWLAAIQPRTKEEHHERPSTDQLPDRFL